MEQKSALNFTGCYSITWAMGNFVFTQALVPHMNFSSQQTPYQRFFLSKFSWKPTGD